MLPPASRYAAVLAALRIFTGVAWLSHGIGKLTNPKWALPGGSFEGIVNDINGGTSGAYHDFVTGIVLPHAALFATLVAWGETLTGVALVLGLFTRFGGAVGTFLALNYWAAMGAFAHWTSIGGLEMVHAALSFVNVLLPTGLVAGLDGVIAARKRPPTMVEKS
jgi:thiosulfate dehydrogenase [quinone] large subunit